MGGSTSAEYDNVVDIQQVAGLRREAMMDVQSADLNLTSSPRVSVCKP